MQLSSFWQAHMVITVTNSTSVRHQTKDQEHAGQLVNTVCSVQTMKTEIVHKVSFSYFKVLDNNTLLFYDMKRLSLRLS